MKVKEKATADDQCPVATLLTEAEKLIDAHKRYQELAAPEAGVPGENDIPATSGGLHFRLDEIETSASFLQATSARGALFQICVASHWLELISEDGTPGNQRRAEMLREVLYSLATFIENIAGARKENAYLEYYMPQFSAPGSQARAI